MDKKPADKPVYVQNFTKPANTEIKHISGHWYLYERKNIYDPAIKRSRKKSGKCLGSITESGFIPSKAGREHGLNDVVEAGAVNYFYQQTEGLRLRLKKHFPDLWVRIYTTTLIRTIYDTRFRRLQLHYEDSILSHLYPDISFSPSSTSAFLKILGRERQAIRAFMREFIAEQDRFIIFDGHRLLSASHTMDNAEVGFDSKKRYKPQINLLYMFSLGPNTGCPVYYKQYLGSTPDVTAFADIMKESGAHGEDCIVVADKGFGSQESFSLLEESCLNYVIPLKRGNSYVSGRIPSSPTGYDTAFSFNGRAILCTTFHEEGFDIHLYLDTSLLAEEAADLTKRTERRNNGRCQEKFLQYDIFLLNQTLYANRMIQYSASATSDSVAGIVLHSTRPQLARKPGPYNADKTANRQEGGKLVSANLQHYLPLQSTQSSNIAWVAVSHP